MEPPANPSSLLLASFAGACAIFFLFAYNSGYGYDALEYLVIGRSLNEGMAFFTYIPSKSPGIYFLVALLCRLGVSFDHRSLTVVITVLYALVLMSTYIVTRRWFTATVSITATILTAVAAPFMELNFFEPTPLFYMCGLCAFHFTLRFEKSNKASNVFLAGVAIGVGLAFKASAAFYGVACALFLALQFVLGRLSLNKLFVRCLILAIGAFAVVGGVAGFFAMRGTLSEFIKWSFIFPVFDYPANTTYIAKAYTKLLWVHLIIIGCIPCFAYSRVRDSVWRDPPMMLALLFGSCAYLALLKTQASHYFFAGAPFLMLFALAVYDKALGTVSLARQYLVTRTIWIGGGFGLALLISTALYRPDALRRLMEVQNFGPVEERFRQFVQARVAADKLMLVTGGSIGTTWAYWVSHRYPPPPFINADVKTIWVLRNRPEEVFRVLNDPRLVLVQFERFQIEHPRMEDVFGNESGDVARMREYFERIQGQFRPIVSPLIDQTFWMRRTVR